MVTGTDVRWALAIMLHAYEHDNRPHHRALEIARAVRDAQKQATTEEGAKVQMEHTYDAICDAMTSVPPAIGGPALLLAAQALLMTLGGISDPDTGASIMVELDNLAVKYGAIILPPEQETAAS
jgi:hypothetical protein